MRDDAVNVSGLSPSPAELQNDSLVLPADGSAAAAPSKADAKPRKKKSKAKAKPSKKGEKSAKKADKKGKKVRKPKKAPAKKQHRHRLYELSVQAPDEDAKFMFDYFRKVTRRRGHAFREDFCGTGTLASNWVQLHKDNTAIGVDLDRPTLDWGTVHNIGEHLDDEQQSRIQLICSDVKDITAPQVDLIAALNFSYSFFMTRDSLREYMERCRESLVDDGVLFLDAWGGSQTQEVMEEEREIVSDDVETFTYIWDQADFDPVSYHSACKIHFRFADGTERRNAFSYKWRQWTLPEMTELMAEAGFHDIHVLWEGTDQETEEGNGIYTRQKRGDADLGWIAYVVGHKNPPRRS